MITSLLYAAPRLVSWSLKMFRKACRLAMIDRAECGAVVDFLHARKDAASFQEIFTAVPTINPVKIFLQMAEIEGVMVLHERVQGLTLSSRLRSELDAIMH